MSNTFPRSKPLVKSADSLQLHTLAGTTMNNPSATSTNLSDYDSHLKNNNSIKSIINSSLAASSRLLAITELMHGRQMTRQPSLNTFTSFAPSVLDLPYVVYQKEFQSTVAGYEQLLHKAANYRGALESLAEAASDFGHTLEESVKSPKIDFRKDVSQGIMNAAGLQYIIGTNQQVLARTLKQSFEEPLAEALTKVKLDYKSNYDFYQNEVKEKTKKLRKSELENIRLSKLKTRNLNAYKTNLVSLTNQVDQIDRLKHDYYQEVNAILDHFSADQLVKKTGSFVRAQLEIYEGIARKGWSGGGLDELLSIAPDLFGTLADNEPQAEEEDNFNDENDGTNSIIDETIDVINGESTIHSPEALVERSTPVASGAASLSSAIDTSFDLPVINNSELILYKGSIKSDAPETLHSSENFS